MNIRRWLALGRFTSNLLAAQGAQSTVQVTGAVKHMLTLSAGDLAKMPRGRPHYE